MDEINSNMSLADLAGVDVSGVESYEYTPLPVGVYEFQFTVNMDDSKTDEDTGATLFLFEATAKIVEVVSILRYPPGTEDKEAYAARFLNQEVRNRFYINAGASQEDKVKAYGRIKKFFENVTQGDVPWTGNLIDNFSAIDGCVVRARIEQVKSRDGSRTFPQLAFGKK